MPDSFSSDINNAINQDTLRRSLMARMEDARLSGERITEDYRNKIAETFLLAGITLFPSDTLLDHQYVVSRGVYEAAMKLAKPTKETVK